MSSSSKFVALIASITLSLAVCAAIFGISLILDPSNKYIPLSFCLTAFLALMMISCHFFDELWEKGKPQTSHIIVGTIYLFGFLMAFLLAWGLIENYIFSKKEDIPPIVVFMTVLCGIAYWIFKYKLPPRADKSRPLWRSPDYTTPEWNPQNEERTTNYDRDDKYAGYSISRGDETIHYDRDDKFAGRSYKK